jgi:hypothetical protein
VRLDRFIPLVRPWTRFPIVQLQRMADPGHGFFEGNNRASGYFTHESLERLQREVDALSDGRGEMDTTPVAGVFNDEGYESLRCAIRYAIQNRLGLIEASDVIVPFTGQCRTDPKNVRGGGVGPRDP